MANEKQQQTATMTATKPPRPKANEPGWTEKAEAYLLHNEWRQGGTGASGNRLWVDPGRKGIPVGMKKVGELKIRNGVQDTADLIQMHGAPAPGWEYTLQEAVENQIAREDWDAKQARHKEDEELRALEEEEAKGKKLVGARK